jgi:hypothetical protein
VAIASDWAPKIAAAMTTFSRMRMIGFPCDSAQGSASWGGGRTLPCDEMTDKRDEIMFQVRVMIERLQKMQSSLAKRRL